MLELQLYPNGVLLTGVTVLYANFFHLQAAMSKTAHSLNESLTTFANNKSFNKLKNAIKYIMLSSTQLKKNLLPNIYQNHQSTLHLLKRSLVTGVKFLREGTAAIFHIGQWQMFTSTCFTSVMTDSCQCQIDVLVWFFNRVYIEQ